LVVSSFAVLGDVLKPKSFAGLFSAAPSIALASIGLAVSQRGQLYAAREASSMIWGAVAFVLYAAIVSQLLFRRICGVLMGTLLSLGVWLTTSLALWFVMAG
jgi:hypothetical protein